MDSEISPNGYSSPLLPTVPTSQKEATDKEREDTLAQLPLLKEVVARLESRITKTDSIKEALIVAQRYKISREQALVVLDLVRSQLEGERNYINRRVKRTKR